MKKRTLLPALGLLAALTACTGQEVAPSPPPVITTPGPVATSEPTIGPIIWQDQVFEQQFETRDGVPVFTARYLLPGITNSELDAAWTAIDDYYRAEGKAYLESAQETADQAVGDYDIMISLGFDFTPYAEEAYYSMTYQGEALVSFRRTYYSDIGTDFPVTFQFSEQFDLETGAQVTFADLFTDPAAAQEMLVKHIQDLAALREDGRYDAARLAINFRPDAFYLTEDSFVFYYQPGDAAATEAGLVEFSILRADCRDMMKRDIP